MRVILICIVSLAAGTIPVGGSLLSKRMADGKRWTMRNLDVAMEGSYCYEEDCRQYGRLYTWESARRACQSLGSEWRLPTDEDWGHLAALYGAGAAYQALLSGGNSEFGALLGGGRDLDGHFARLEAHGFYWTATEDVEDRGSYLTRRGIELPVVREKSTMIGMMQHSAALYFVAIPYKSFEPHSLFCFKPILFGRPFGTITAVPESIGKVRNVLLLNLCRRLRCFSLNGTERCDCGSTHGWVYSLEFGISDGRLQKRVGRRSYLFLTLRASRQIVVVSDSEIWSPGGIGGQRSGR